MRTTAILASVVVLALAGCGGGDESSSSGGSATSTPTAASGGGGGGGEKLALAAPADGSLKFDKTKLDAKAGTVTIDFDNPSSTPHAVEIEGNGVEEETDTITQGKAAVTADLKPGTYTFYCPVDSHRSQGMEGTLTVK